ncbi:hypothetical protein L1049_024676 [Liquidambar formosana]|uniref:Uncharacterized protein n=1 Tax=Liquidambar formosana TaxID=63359 RepID=A0AAP0S1E3_LIQFO
MASTTQRLVVLRLSILLGLLSISANARPCKTLFISSYSFTFKPHFYRNPDLLDQNPNPNLAFQNPSEGSVTFFTEIRQFNPKPSEIVFHNGVRFPIPLRLVDPDVAELEPRPASSGFFSSAGFDSLRDRTKDVLSVVVALLFGVGCGALTAATMYLAWSLFSNRYEFRSSFDEFDDEDDIDDDVSPKKMGYVKIPADAAPVPAPAKEVMLLLPFVPEVIDLLKSAAMGNLSNVTRLLLKI